MARYRKVSTRIWNDAAFREFSDAGKLCFLFILTHPSMTSLGGMRATLSGLAEELGWSPEAFREAFREALSKGMVKHDEKASLIFLPKFIRHNPPESPNVVKSWESQLELIPECELQVECVQAAYDFVKGLGKAFAEALPEAFRKAMPNPYPYLEPESQVVNSKPSLPSKPTKSPRKQAGTSVSSGRGFDAKNLKDPLRVLAYTKSRGIDTGKLENRVRSLAAALAATAGDKPGGLFVTLIEKGAGGDWSTVSDEYHEPAKQWLKTIERPTESEMSFLASVGAES